MKSRIIAIAIIFLFIMNTKSMGLTQEEDSTAFILSTCSDITNIGEQIKVTITGMYIKDVFSYELLLSFDKESLELVGEPESLINGASFSKIRDNTIQFGCIKQVGKIETAENLPLCTFTFQAKATGSASIVLDRIKTYNIQLQEQKYTINKNISVMIENTGKTDDYGMTKELSPCHYTWFDVVEQLGYDSSLYYTIPIVFITNTCNGECNGGCNGGDGSID